MFNDPVNPAPLGAPDGSKPILAASEYQDYQVEGPAVATKRGCGTGCLIVFLVSLSAFVLLAICCGGVFSSVQSMKDSMTFDREEVQASADEILRLDLPEEFSPDVSYRLSLMLVAEMDVAMFHSGGDASKLLLVRWGSFVGNAFGNDPQGAVRQSRQLLQDPSKPDPLIGLTPAISEREITVLDKPTTAYITGYANEDGEIVRLEVATVVPTEEGTVVVLFDVAPSDHTEDELIEVIENANPPVVE